MKKVNHKLRITNYELRSPGFTLVEMMITISIFAIGFVVIAAIYVGISTAQNRSRNSVAYLNEAQLVFEQISRLIRDQALNQDALTCPSNCGTPNAYLCLKDIANGKTFVRFVAPINNIPGFVQISRSNSCTNASWITLSDPTINIQDLKFYTKFPSTQVPDEQAMTTISMTVSGTGTTPGQPALQLQTAVSSRVFIGNQ